jgi:hypothetical protein
MKTVKSVFLIVMAFALVLSFGASVFAEDTKRIVPPAATEAPPESEDDETVVYYEDFEDAELEAARELFFKACKARYGADPAGYTLTPEYVVDFRREYSDEGPIMNHIFVLETCDLKAVTAEIKGLVGNADAFKTIKIIKTTKQDFNRNTINQLMYEIGAKLKKEKRLKKVEVYPLVNTDSGVYGKQFSHTTGNISTFGVQIVINPLTDAKIKQFKALIMDHPALYFSEYASPPKV